MTPTQQLIAEARRHDAEMTEGPWTIGETYAGDYDTVSAVKADDAVVCVEPYDVRGYSSCCIVTPNGLAANQEGIAWCRNNLRAIADALESAPRWCERPTGPGLWVSEAGDYEEFSDEEEITEEIQLIAASMKHWGDDSPMPQWYGPIPPAPGAPQP